MSLDRISLEKINLFLRARSLPKFQGFNNIVDPFAAAFVLNKQTNQMALIGTTEILKDCVDPHWTTTITLDYVFEDVQPIVVRVYHSVSGHPLKDVSKHDLIGEVSFNLSTVMLNRDQCLKLSLLNPSRSGVKLGDIEIRGESLANVRDLLVVTFSAQKLVNKDGFFNKSDPFLEISRCNEDGSYTIVWRSPKIDNNLNPKWNTVKIPLTTLCNGDIDRPLRLAVWDFEKSGKHQAMGCVENSSVRSLLQLKGAPMEIIEADKKAKSGKSYKNSGTLSALDVTIEVHPSFADYLAGGGCEVSLMVGIDFTGSNGDPRDKKSLHYIDPTASTWNIYQQAIHAVGSVLEPYDNDKLYTVLGFGAKVRLGDGTFSTVQHCFPVYGGSNQVQGLQGIMQAYSDAMNNVMLSGPTLLAPLINATCQIIVQQGGCYQDAQKYYVLLILTDGVVNDMEATKLAIIQASRLPLSVIIIGVGPADFSDMRALDSDDKLLTVGNFKSERDIVQFVAFSPQISAGNVAQQVLAEVPNQVLQFMAKNGILPMNRR